MTCQGHPSGPAAGNVFSRLYQGDVWLYILNAKFQKAATALAAANL